MAEFKVGTKIMRLPDVISGFDVIKAQGSIIKMQGAAMRLQKIRVKYNFNEDMMNMKEEEMLKLMSDVEPEDLAILTLSTSNTIKDSIEYYQELKATFSPPLEEWTYNEMLTLVTKHNAAIQERIMGEKLDLSKK